MDLVSKLNDQNDEDLLSLKKTILSFWEALFSGAIWLVLGRVTTD